MKKRYIVFIIISFCNLFGQNNFHNIDSVAISTKYTRNLNELVNELTENLKSDIDKTRSIYSWITENISYDYKTFNKGKQKKIIKCKNDLNCIVKKQKIENQLIKKVLRKKKAICSGYSLLFKKMCEIANLQCLNITGYIKTKPHHIGRKGVLDHAWNGIIIDNQTYFLDLTWASGYCETDQKGKLSKFIKQKNDFYWFTPVEKFTIDHFPQHPEKIFNFNISENQYKNQPYIEKSIIPFLEIEYPKQGIIYCKIGDTINFKIKCINPIQKLQINTNIKRNPKFYFVEKNGAKTINQKAFEKQEYIDFEKQNEVYNFSYFIKNEKLKYIEIIFDYNLKLKYLIKMSQ